MKSPSGGSILKTSAPRSASRRVQYGPDTMVVKSRTRTPARISLSIGRLDAILFLRQREIVAIEALQMLFHLGHRRVDLARLEMLHETVPRGQHPSIVLLADRANEVLHHEIDAAVAEMEQH